MKHFTFSLLFMAAVAPIMLYAPNALAVGHVVERSNGLIQFLTNRFARPLAIWARTASSFLTTSQRRVNG